MATTSLVTSFQSSPNYWTTYTRSVPAGEPFNDMLNGAGTGGGSQSGSLLISNSSGTPSYATLCSLFDIAFDLRETQLLTITSATLSFNCKNSTVTGLLNWLSDADNGVTVTAQRESVRGVNLSSPLYYAEVQAGRATEYATSIPWSSLPGATGSVETWTFNSAGLAYLNSVATKTYNPGYAFLALQWKGNVAPIAPIADGANRFQRLDPVTAGGADQMTLTLGFDPSTTAMAVNVGDTWKAVAGAKINVSNSWRTISEVGVNIGDVWKDVS